MKTGWRRVGLTAMLAIGVAACAEKTGADNFVGTWVAAGAINPNCLEAAPIDLTGARAVITASDSSHFKVDLQGYCTVNFEADGFTATAASGQSCALPVTGLGTISVAITEWTLTASGDTIASSFTGSALGCIPTGNATLTRVGDAGTTD